MARSSRLARAFTHLGLAAVCLASACGSGASSSPASGGSGSSPTSGGSPVPAGGAGSTQGGSASSTEGGAAGSPRGGSGGTQSGTSGRASGGDGAQAGTGTGGAGALAGSGGEAPDSEILVPAEGALLGQYYGDASIAETSTKLGRTLKIHLTYWAWSDDWTKGATAADLAAGRIPLVNWEPADIDFHDIVSGSLDDTIQARAKGAKALGSKFFLDFAAEMNGEEAWSGNDAPLYVAAYRHIHDLFVAAGATNVIWAWCPNVTDTDNTNAHTLDYYPGDDYVDWTGVDGYNWGDGDWQSFGQVFRDIYPILAGKKKPILIGEMSSSEAGGDKAAWISAMIPTLKQDFPLIRAVVWFDVKKERDWRISSSSATEAAFKALAADPFFNP